MQLTNQQYNEYQRLLNEERQESMPSEQPKNDGAKSKSKGKGKKRSKRNGSKRSSATKGLTPSAVVDAAVAFIQTVGGLKQAKEALAKIEIIKSL